jgi:hypothetical protein
MNMVINFRVPYMAGDFLTSSVTVSFSRTLLHRERFHIGRQEGDVTTSAVYAFYSSKTVSKSIIATQQKCSNTVLSASVCHGGGGGGVVIGPT